MPTLPKGHPDRPLCSASRVMILLGALSLLAGTLTGFGALISLSWRGIEPEAPDALRGSGASQGKVNGAGALGVNCYTRAVPSSKRRGSYDHIPALAGLPDEEQKRLYRQAAREIGWQAMVLWPLYMGALAISEFAT